MEVPLTPLAFVARGVELYPDRTAVRDGRVERSYADFAGRVERLAGALRGMGLEEGDRVALLAPNTAEALEAYTGVPLAGCVLVPVNIRLSEEEIAYILDHSGARVLLVDAALLGTVQAVLGDRPHILCVVQGLTDGEESQRDNAVGAMRQGRAVSYEALLKGATPIALDAERVHERAPITLNYTSGTTGRPKGVLLTHRGTCINALHMIWALGLRRDDVHLHVAPMFHAAGWGFVWAPFAVGATHVPLRRVDGFRVLDAAASFDVSTFCAASTVLVGILEALRQRPEFRAPRPIRVATAAGAPTPEILEQVEGKLGWKVVHLYGMTETSAFVTMSEDPPDADRLTAGERAARKARQGVPLLLAGRVRVVHPDGTDVRPDGVDMGEVICRGNVIMEGYEKDPEGTRAALRDGWLHTGDLAVRHPDGSLEIRDRIKDVVKSGGEQIPSLEVERVLALHPAILEAAVVARPDPYWGETPMAFLVAREGTERPSDEEIRTLCRSHLSHFKVPRWFAWLDALPRNGAGKVQKSLLRTWAREAAHRESRPSVRAEEGQSRTGAPEAG